MKVMQWFKDLPWLGYVISSVIVSIGALIVYAKDVTVFRFEEYLLMAFIGWVLVFVFMIFFVLFMGREE